MSPDFLALLQDPARIAELPDQELPGLLLKTAGLLTALSSRAGGVFQGNDPPEARTNGEDHLLTVPQVAELLNVPKGYAYELARRGAIPTVRFGKYVRVPVASLREWIARHQGKGIDIFVSATLKSPRDRLRDPQNPKAAAAHPSPVRQARRRSSRDRQPVGTRSPGDPGVDRPTHQATGKNSAEGKV